MIPRFRELNHFEQLGLILWIWALLWLIPCLIALSRNLGARWNGFWLMSGLWVVVDAAIGVLPFVTEAANPEELRTILRFNAGLDVGYIIVGAVLWSRSKPLLKGFGFAIIIQGIFLLALDLTFARRIE